ncbi:MAG TPA: M56 family metallopeptidase [Steroidobacteraceae bacterium]|jgi:beta-lactamase regulating signal transducer with metallopeptidase domain
MAAFLLTHLWQSTLVVMGAWVLVRACSSNAAAVRYWIWFVASAKFLLPLALLQQLGDRLGRSFPEPLPVDAGLIEKANAMFAPSIPGGLQVADPMPSQIAWIAAVIWTFGAAVLCLRWFVQWRSIRSLLAFAPEISMDVPAPVRVTSGDLTTGVFGILRPVVILPRQLLETLEPRQVQAVLAHEACHVRRRDNLTAAIHRCVEVLFWFHPLVWWIGANLLREREGACDEAVVDEGHEQGLYAESILHACRLGVTARSTTVAASTGGDLCQRLSSIMSERRARPMTRERFTALFALATLLCFAPLVTGIAIGAIREVSGGSPVALEIVRLQPAAAGRWRSSSSFDPQTGRLVLRNFSLRNLIDSAYPASIVNADRVELDGVRYDIEAHWRPQGALANTSERKTYRELLVQVVESTSNYEIHVTDLH